MITVVFNHQELDLYKNTVVDYVLNSPAFVGGDILKVNGSYTLPFDIPLTPRNRLILNFPDIIENNDFLLTDIPCQILFDRKPFFAGLATVKKPVRSRGVKSVKLNVVQDSYKTLKNNDLTDLTLEDFEFNTVQDVLDHAKDTALNPLSHSHAFFPVYNPRMTDDFEVTSVQTQHKYVNYYDTPTQEFVSDPNQRSATPFCRLDYILEKIGEFVDKAVINEFADTDELKALYMYCDKNLYTETDDVLSTGPSEWSTSFSLSEFVPKIKLSEFLKMFARLFCLGIFPDATSFRIVPLRRLVTHPYQQDWTAYAEDAYDFDTVRDYPQYLSYGSAGDELFRTNEFEDLQVPEFEKESDIPATSPDGIYYLTSENKYVKKRGTFITFHKRMFLRTELHPDGVDFSFKSAPLFMTNRGGRLPLVPHILSSPGSVNTLRLMFYRGMHQNSLSQLYPMATNHVYGPFQNRLPASYSLLWNAPEGMYDRWWSVWSDFLRNKKNVFRIMHLPIREIINMRFQNKVRIENKHYLVKQLKVRMTMKGLKPSRAELVTVI